METSWNENHAALRGTVDALPAFSHENHGVAYQVFPLAVPRLSGTVDRLNVVAGGPPAWAGALPPPTRRAGGGLVDKKKSFLFITKKTPRCFSSSGDFCLCWHPQQESNL